MSCALILLRGKQKYEIEVIKYLVRRNHLSICLLPAKTDEY